MFSCIAMRMNVKRKLYEEVNLPTARYGAETWSMKKKRLNVMEMRCQRSMCGVTCMERVTNEVRTKTGVTRVG